MTTESLSLFARASRVADSITYKPGCRLVCLWMKVAADKPDKVFYRVECPRIDVVTGEMGVGRGGVAYLFDHMTDGDLVRTAFGLFRAYEEHEAREWFKYRSVAVFSPHIHIDALLEAGTHTDYQKED